MNDTKLPCSLLRLSQLWVQSSLASKLPVNFAKKNSKSRNSQACTILQFLSFFSVFLGWQKSAPRSMLYIFLFISLSLPDDLINFNLFIQNSHCSGKDWLNKVLIFPYTWTSSQKTRCSVYNEQSMKWKPFCKVKLGLKNLNISFTSYWLKRSLQSKWIQGNPCDWNLIKPKSTFGCNVYFISEILLISGEIVVWDTGSRWFS